MINNVLHFYDKNNKIKYILCEVKGEKVQDLIFRKFVLRGNLYFLDPFHTFSR